MIHRQEIQVKYDYFFNYTSQLLLVSYYSDAYTCSISYHEVKICDYTYSKCILVQLVDLMHSVFPIFHILALDCLQMWCVVFLPLVSDCYPYCLYLLGMMMVAYYFYLLTAATPIFPLALA